MTEFETMLEVEEWLQDNDVFYNGISNKSCHSDSYMTMVNFENLDKAIQDAEFKESVIKDTIAYWMETGVVSLKCAARVWKRKLEQELKAK